MKHHRKLLLGLFLGSTTLTAPVFAQYVGPSDVPPVHSKTDEFNVDLVTLNIAAQVYGSISIGPSGPGGLRYAWASSDRAGTDLNVGLNVSGSTYSVYIGPSTTTFTLSGTLGTGTFTNNQANGATLAYSSTADQFTFTERDGTVLIFGKLGLSYYPLTLTYPAGEQLTYNYYEYGTTGYYYYRSVTSNLGYQFRPTVNSDGSWSKAVVFNMADETCDPTAVSCTLTNSWPTIDFGAQTVNGNPVTKWASQANSTTGGTTVTATIPVTSTINETETYQEDSNGRVTSVSDGNGTWTYAYPPNSQGVTYKYAAGGSRQIRVTEWNTTTGVVTSDVLLGNPGADSYSSTYDTYQRLTSFSRNGVTATYTYDGNGNVTKTVTTDGANPITTTAVFPSSGCNAKTCNQPTSTTDANGNTTSYTYDSNSGGPATITYPAVGGVHPAISYTYAAKNETWKSGTGATITGTNVYRPTSISRCMTQATCSATTNANDQVLTTIGYDTSNGLQPSSVTTGTNGSASPVLQATTAYTYDGNGDVATLDGPLPGTADTTAFYYDNDHRLTGTIRSLPGNGQPRRAVKVSYTSGGDVDTTSLGTATAQSSSALSSMTVLQKSQASYNVQGLKIEDTLYDSNNAVAGITQYNYSPERRLQCTAVRNNSSTWTSQSDACHQTTTNTDLITKSTWDDLGDLLTVRNGYTSDTQTPDMTNTWGSPNKLTSQQDGNGKTTTYSYDTFNRLVSTCYPDTSVTTGASSTTDCEKITAYDANGNVTGRQLRGGSSLSYTFDALNRLATKVLPEGTVTYSYDLLGHLTSLAQGTTTLSFTYDQLGRNLTQVSPQGTVTSGWDLAGRRTSIAYPVASGATNLTISYNYLTTGEVSSIADGATSLAAYAYDALGNRTSITYGNSTSQTYSYDTLYRPSTLTSDLAGTTYDSCASFGYNPASQLASTTRGTPSCTSTTNAYSWNAALNTNRNYTVNPLNQYTAAGSTSFTYDAKGNLAQSGSTYYCYNSENRLTASAASSGCASPTATLGYDPAGRLASLSASGKTTNFAYDGVNLIDEYNGSSLTNRYVFGPAVDEPIVSYDSAGNRTWLVADERGSIVATANSSGTPVASSINSSSGSNGIDTYDEYGIPGSTNSGRFQYTGQVYLSEIGMYYYKNRMYSTTLGRFMQTDPVGYGDGMNWYAYVHNDPVNGSDPAGLGTCEGGPFSGSTCQNTLAPQVYTDDAGNYGVYTTDGANYKFELIGGNIEDDLSSLQDGDSSIGELPSMSGQLIQAKAPSSSAGCVQSKQNAASLDYSQRLYKGGTQTTEEHIIERHLSGTSNVSQYSTSGGFDAIRRTNYYTYLYGVESFHMGSIVFDLVHPLAFLGFTTGTNASGGDAYTNHLVVLPDCKTVVTSYPR